MKRLGLVLLLCGAAGLAMMPAGAYAFEIQGEGQDTPESPAEALGLNPVYTLPKFDGYSLAMPLAGGGDQGSSFVSDYGNAIPIPAPGIDQPSPAWATPGLRY
ncbi:MAG: hypothetical protein R3D30_00130 [Hyphomicrobiales bacterium]